MAAPRRWGYTLKDFFRLRLDDGCPTQVGIYLADMTAYPSKIRLPHAGGDIPLTALRSSERCSAAPRRWGYTSAYDWRCASHIGCPTQVGIYPLLYVPFPRHLRLPHAGGDIPYQSNGYCTIHGAAPRRWGYTPCITQSKILTLGCPTQVGIYRYFPSPTFVLDWLPHAGGDIPGCQCACMSV